MTTVTSEPSEEQTALSAFADGSSSDTDDVDTEADEVEAVLEVLDRQTELLERVVDEVAAEPTPTDRTADHTDTDEPAPVSRAFW